MESAKMRPVATAPTKSEYRRMEPEELDEEEWARMAEAQCHRRRSGERYVYTCALFASLNAILLGYGQSPALSHLPLPRLPATTPTPSFRSRSGKKKAIFV
ncbi:hypothetical protein ABZP36_007703 [Zizania latifolia]